MRLKVLVVNPNNRLKTPLSAVEPPLWAGLIATYHNADILDAEAEDLTLEETEIAIRLSRQKDILIVVMGNNPSVSSTPKMPISEKLADRISDLNVSFTGLHPIAVNYKKYPVCIKPFEGFPMMPWEKLPMYLYKAHNWHCLDGSPRVLYASIYTSLGCPFNCYYCNIHTLYGDRQVRFRPIPDVLKEVDRLAQLGIRNIKIWDELFALKEDRVLSICDGLKDYNFNIWCYARVDTITEKMLKAMKKAHINWIAYGFESGDSEMRRSIQKNTSQTQTERAIQMTRDVGINMIANLMFWGDDNKTLEWAKRHLFEFVNFYVAKPYPGSQWYEDTKPIREWGSYDQYSKKGEDAVRDFRDKAFTEYFTNPLYLEMITKKFGNQAVTQIQEMLTWHPR
jgi:anaerobic magnesium-protoporphyrin IX monomethyl ester cyclase